MVPGVRIPLAPPCLILACWPVDVMSARLANEGPIAKEGVMQIYGTENIAPKRRPPEGGGDKGDLSGWARKSSVGKFDTEHGFIRDAAKKKAKRRLNKRRARRDGKAACQEV